LIAHKIALDPNNVQATYFARASGTARFAYNWALAEWQRQYEACKVDLSLPKPSQMALRRQLNSLKGEKFPWMLDVTKNAPQMAIIQLGAAFKNFFAGRAKPPKFRKKGIHDRFSLTNDQFSIDGSSLRLPHLGWVRMRETLRFTGKIMSATVSRVADKWFVSLTVDTPDDSHRPKAKNQGVVGVDLGVSALATLSTGENITGPKAHKALLSRLQRLSRNLSRKVCKEKWHFQCRAKCNVASTRSLLLLRRWPRLAQQLGVDEKEVRRLLDPHYASKLPRIAQAVAALGKRLVIGLEAA
jgi:putative transposase